MDRGDGAMTKDKVKERSYLAAAISSGSGERQEPCGEHCSSAIPAFTRVARTCLWDIHIGVKNIRLGD
ncbi:hypothetical protein OUZ56_027782 [Daphnia magna]|uniref:Uncharacterized protein n=1 Tax=Daphnia magna TaxID=35525 RepID=A0ABR0B1X3_9CRUS|nr:hypothetical protein OUZ56_027782 [Daphnia magna]